MEESGIRDNHLGITKQQFEKLVTNATDNLPEHFGQAIKNVVFVVEDEPSDELRVELNLGSNGLLFGLFQGIPRVAEVNNNSGRLPNKISIFRLPIIAVSKDLSDLIRMVNRTVWHEVAHYFGLNHAHIHKLEQRIDPASLR